MPQGRGNPNQNSKGIIHIKLCLLSAVFCRDQTHDELLLKTHGGSAHVSDGAICIGIAHVLPNVTRYLQHPLQMPDGRLMLPLEANTQR